MRPPSPWLGVVLGIVILVLAPMFFGWLGVFFDDYYETFSNLAFLAETVKDGHLPLWDPHVFAGGRVNYLPNTRVWYWPLYPFYLLAPSANVDGAYFWLIKLPLLVHWLLAALGAWLLGRRAVRLGPEGAAALAVVYALGAGMTYNICDPNTTYAVVWVPWALFGIDSLARNGRGPGAAAGALAVAFIGPCGSDVRAIFSLAAVAVLVAVLALFSWWQRDRRYAGKLCVSAAAVFMLGFLLSAPYWLGMAETARTYRASPLLSEAWAASPMFSMPWRHLATVVLPDLFGTLTCSQGVNLGFPGLEDYLHVEGNLTGGYFLVLIVVLGALAGLGRRKGEIDEPAARVRRRWWSASVCLIGLSWLLVTGSYSPVYLALVKTIPACGLPYAVRWRILEHLGMALAAGVSVHWLFESPRPLQRWGALALGALIVGIFISQGMYAPPGGRPAASIAWERYRSWLLTGPGALLLVVLLTTGLVAVFRRRRWMKTFLLGALMAEAAVQGFLVVYFLEWADVPEWVKYRYPSETAYYRVTAAAPLPVPASGPWRTAYYFSLLDQTATLHGGEYLFGHCSKPLIPRWREVVEDTTTGYPYALRLRDPGMRFYPNMSVARIWLEPTAPGGKPVEYRPRDVLPRVFTQTRAVASTPEESKEELLRGDLRRAAFVETSPTGSLESIGYEEVKTLDNPGAAFDELQRRNRVENVRSPSPTRMNIAVSVEVPALLVTTDVFHPDWEVRIDGASAVPLRVNYLQRAVYLEPGEHEVEWSFRPPAVRWGLVLAAAGLLGTAVLAVTRRPRRVR